MAGGRMTRGRPFLSWTLAVVFVLALATAPALADDTLAVVSVHSYDHQLGHATTLWVEVNLPDNGPDPYSIAVSVPPAYDTTPLHPTGNQLGDAEVDAVPVAGGAQQRYPGNLVVTDAAAFKDDPQAQACAPEAHTATWRLVLSGPAGSVLVPVAVDLVDGAYRLTVCLAPVHALGLKAVTVYFRMRDVFRNPTATGLYRWSALVTPTGAGGAADAATVFELRADQRLPEILGMRPTYDRVRKTLTVQGTLSAAGTPRSGIRVHVYGGNTSNLDKFKELGVAVTAKNGAYVLKRRMSVRPVYVFALVNYYQYQGCDQPSKAPGGCASETVDGVTAGPTRVRP